MNGNRSTWSSSLTIGAAGVAATTLLGAACSGPVSGLTVAGTLVCAAWACSASPRSAGPSAGWMLIPWLAPLLIALTRGVAEWNSASTGSSLAVGGMAAVLTGGCLVHAWGTTSRQRISGTAAAAVSPERVSDTGFTAVAPLSLDTSIHPIDLSTAPGGSPWNLALGADTESGNGHDLDAMIDEEAIESSLESDDAVVQQFTRIRHAEEDRIEGMVRVEFAANQRQIALHLPIVPPFASVPSGWCEAEGDDGLRAEIDVLRPFGVRVTVRRTGRELPSSSARVLITLTAESREVRAA